MAIEGDNESVVASYDVIVGAQKRKKTTEGRTKMGRKRWRVQGKNGNMLQRDLKRSS